MDLHMRLGARPVGEPVRMWEGFCAGATGTPPSRPDPSAMS